MLEYIIQPLHMKMNVSCLIWSDALQSVTMG